MRNSKVVKCVKCKKKEVMVIKGFANAVHYKCCFANCRAEFTKEYK